MNRDNQVNGYRTLQLSYANGGRVEPLAGSAFFELIRGRGGVPRWGTCSPAAAGTASPAPDGREAARSEAG
ncbi:hypothetical protein ABT294_39195 [Nonomuraea sp. NPDC000554]|uniref:hypothetical protein n=1 Tax=Nonomuraea sp. NPDC000554 TaxID=3154259 RepID=UPI003318FEE6